MPNLKPLWYKRRLGLNFNIFLLLVKFKNIYFLYNVIQIESISEVEFKNSRNEAIIFTVKKKR